MKLLTLLPVIAILFLGGCITLTVDQAVESSGYTSINMSMSMGAIGMLSSGCENTTRPAWVDTYSCGYNGTATVVHMAGQLPSDMFTVNYGIPYVTYKLDMPSDAIGEQSQSSKMSPSQLAMLKGYGASMVWKITMPGKIIHAPNGNITGKNTAKFDLLEMAASGKQMDITAESRALNWFPVMLIAGVLLIAMALLVGGTLLLFFVKMRKKQ